MIKILYVNYSLDVGGIETLVLAICKRLDAKQYVPEVCAFVDAGRLQPEFEKAGIKVHIIKRVPGIDASLPFKLSKLIKQRGIDIIHAQNVSSWLYCAPASFLSGKPLIYTAHTSSDYSGLHIYKWRLVENILARFTKRVTTVAAIIAEYMKKKEFVPANKIEVIYNGIDCKKYEQSVDVVLKKRELGIKESEYVIGNVARLTPVKNHELLITAFEQIKERIPNARLFVAGEGPLKEQLTDFIKQLSLESFVTLMGDRRDIHELLKVFDVFVLPSLKEGFPMVLLEAMAASIPVIATDVGGNKELVLNGETGLVIPPNNANALQEAIMKLHDFPDLAKTMGKNGERRVQEGFTFDMMINKYEKVYASLLK